MTNNFNVNNEDIIKPILNFPDYEISSNGSILNIKTLRILEPTIKDNGYYSVQLNRLENGIKVRKCCYLHRLLATAFLENIDNKPIIDHINRNPLDNRLSNLRFATYSENALNCKKRKNRKGYKNILEDKYRYRFVVIVEGKRKIDRSFSKKRYCIEQVINFRNSFLTKNFISIVD